MFLDEIQLSALAFGLLHFGPFVRSLCAIASLFVFYLSLWDGKGSSEWLKKIKRCSEPKMKW